MASTKVGSFQLNASTGNQSVTGVGFEPKLVIFLASPSTVSVTTQTANAYFNVGVTDGTNQYSMAGFSINGAGTSNTSIQQDDTHCISMIESAVIYSASIVSLDSDGFTINIDDAPADVYAVGYLAFGGNDLNVSIGTFDCPASTGTDAVAGVGFQPDALILTTLARSSAFGTTVADEDIRFGFGFSDGTNEFSSTYFAVDDGLISNTARNTAATAGRIIHATEDTDPPVLQAAVSSFDANGFTLNWNTVTSGAKVLYIALNGPSFNVGSLQLNNSTGNQSVTGVGFEPGTIMTASAAMSTSNGVTSGGKLSLGFSTDPTEQFTIGLTDEDGQGTTDSDFHLRTDHLFRSFDYSLGKLEEFDLGSFDSDGFTLDITDADSNPSYVGYLLMEDGEASNGGGGDNPTGGSGGDDSPDSSFLFNLIGV